MLFNSFLLHTFTQDARKRFDKASLVYDQVSSFMYMFYPNI
jgi:hypothetical protein